MTTTRFAPSPNGPLHLGHAFSAITAHDLAAETSGRFVLRIEDIDGPRSRVQLADEFRRDLEWLGLEWSEVPAQSTRLASYDAAAERLKAAGLLYPCICTRAQIAQHAVRSGPEGPIYPGTCKGQSLAGDGPFVWRLDVAAALEHIAAERSLPSALTWEDALAGPQMADPLMLGDAVLLRKDAPASYHLAATLDDAADGVTLVTRGGDLFSATHIHRLLQSVLGLPVPRWHHHALLYDADGKKLAKRRGSPSLVDRRMSGEDGHKLAERLRQHDLPSGISLGKV